jgi:hypothetical protein
MTRPHRKLPERFRAADSRVRRVRAKPRLVAAEPDDSTDLSGLIFCGQA